MSDRTIEIITIVEKFNDSMFISYSFVMGWSVCFKHVSMRDRHAVKWMEWDLQELARSEIYALSRKKWPSGGHWYSNCLLDGIWIQTRHGALLLMLPWLLCLLDMTQT